MTNPKYTDMLQLPDPAALASGTDMLVVFRRPVAPTMPPAGQPGLRSNWTPVDPELFVVLLADGRVIAFNGHVDYGTGIRTSLAQIVAEELSVPLDRVIMVLGHTGVTPNQGPTIASASIQISAIPLRHAAAQVRQWLIAQAAAQAGIDAESVTVVDGEPAVKEGISAVVPNISELLSGRRVELLLDCATPTKPRHAYRVVGQAVPRVDIPGKATGGLTYVQDMRLPGMLHARVVRPPWVGRDQGAFIGHSLIEVDRASVNHIPGVVAVVVEGDFVGVVAEREEQAIRAAAELRVQWKTPPSLPAFDDLDALLSAQPVSPRPLQHHGDVDAALARGDVLRRRYVWPYQLHASIGPSCSVANYEAAPAGEIEPRLTVWSGTQYPQSVRADVAALLALDESRIDIRRMETSGCYGRNCADDVGADAALLSRATGRPVRVQLSRAQEHGWEPKGAAQLMTVAGTVDKEGRVAAYDFTTCYPSDDAPTLALLLTGACEPRATPYQMGDRTAVPPYQVDSLRVVCNDMSPIVRASWLRGVSALPNSFAHESWMDEAAYRAQADPLAFRLRHLDAARARDTLRAAAERLGWTSRVAASEIKPDASIVRGRGLAYAQYVHGKFPGVGAAMTAWAVELDVDVRTGVVRVQRVVVSQDSGLIINPAGVRHQVHGNVIQALSRTLKEQVMFDENGPCSREWGGYPVLTFNDIPEVEVVLLERDEFPPLGVGESASVPGPAAIANAIFDATGIRLTEVPFTTQRLHAALRSRGLGADCVVPVA